MAERDSRRTLMTSFPSPTVCNISWSPRLRAAFFSSKIRRHPLCALSVMSFTRWTRGLGSMSSTIRRNQAGPRRTRNGRKMRRYPMSDRLALSRDKVGWKGDGKVG